MCNYSQHLLNMPVDVSGDFRKMENEYFLAAESPEFDPQTGRGMLTWKHIELKVFAKEKDAPGVFSPCRGKTRCIDYGWNEKRENSGWLRTRSGRKWNGR